VLSILGRWIFRAAVALAALFVAAYGADFALYRLRGSPRSTVTVSRYMGIPLKGQKEEYDYLGTVSAPCSVSLFPQGGADPCWHLRRNPNQWDNL
jgi:hypothetical protein